MTEYQKNADEFEVLSEQIVHHIFKDTKATIVKTEKLKDGGYDIVVECSVGKKTHKAYFECKLRSKNMNLRDIAANVIIAYNEGAITMVALTNHNYTAQADEQLSLFLEKTILNIKIIIGDDINNLAKKFNIQMQDALAVLIKPTGSNRNLENKLLQIDFSKDNVHNQLFETPKNMIDDAQLWSGFTDIFMSALTVLQEGGLLALTGLIGVGKRRLVNSFIPSIDGIAIWIQASLHQTQERVLMDILLGIWGISITNLFEDFSETHIDGIIERLSRKISNIDTLNILRRLLGDARVEGVNNEHYNTLICDYIVELLKMHSTSFNYLFVFENLAYAKHEIYVLLSYLISKLSQNSIPCIVIQDTEELNVQRSVNLFSSFGHLHGFKPIEIKAFSKDDAEEYIIASYPEIPKIISKEIINHVGTRYANINIFIRYLRNKGIAMSDNKRIAIELLSLQPNSIPYVFHKAMTFYKEQMPPTFFDAMFLLRGKVSDRLCIKLAISVEVLDILSRDGIVSFHQGYYVCANRVVREIIENWGHDDSPRLRKLALDILDIWKDDYGFDIRYEKAHLYKYIGKYEQSLEELLPYIEHLESERQLDAYCEACDVVIDIYQKQRKPLETMAWVIKQLNIFAIQKKLFTPKATKRLDELAHDLDSFAYLCPPKHYTLAYDYFTFLIEFKKGNYDTNVNSGLLMRHYFNNAVNKVEVDNYDDWLGKICERYVLCIKESEGYEAALAAFNKILKVLPESNRVRRGYLSHLACMCLHNKPDKAFGYYSDIIETLHDTKGPYSPFHEYVDRAMCKLLANDLSSAEKYARHAIEICEANAILDEWGRSLNILGCVLVCRGRNLEARTCFKESLEMLKISEYKLYCWRSQLNYIHAELECGGDEELALRELDDAYQCFTSLHNAKLHLLLENGEKNIIQTREYHALLAFAVYRSKLKGKIDSTLTDDFDFGHLTKRYLNDLQLLLNNPEEALPGSVFYRNRMIMTVG